MSNTYFCTKISQGKIELIQTEHRQCRWVHIGDLAGVLTTEQRIPFNEINSNQLQEIIENYKGNYIPFNYSK